MTERRKRKPASAEALAYIDRYDKEHSYNVKLKLNKIHDTDIIDWFERQPNKQGAVKELIRKEIQAGK